MDSPRAPCQSSGSPPRAICEGFMRWFSAFFAAVLIAALPLAAQDVVPDRFVSITQDVDFPGGDLRPIFDTTLSACEAACRADPDCAGFTYNASNGACFPKSAIGEPVAYGNALSGQMRVTDPAVLARLDERLGALDVLTAGDLSAARDQALGLGRAHYAGQFSPEAWRDAAVRAEAEGNRLGAMRMFGAAVTLGDQALTAMLDLPNPAPRRISPCVPRARGPVAPSMPPSPPSVWVS